MNCRLCKHDKLSLVIDLGKMPIAHRLLPQHGVKEDVFPYQLFHCEQCHLVQVVEPIDPDILYRSYNYNFSSWKFEPHIDEELAMVMALGPYTKAFEIGCNDGRFLQELSDRGITQVTGTEPNPVACKVTAERGFSVYNDMINQDVVEKALATFGKFDLVISRQVIEHVPDLDNFFKCINQLLSDDGVLFLDFPDFDINLKATDCSIFWEEHVSYFTEGTMSALLEKHGLSIIEAQRYDFSGGVLAVAARCSAKATQPRKIDFDAALYRQQIGRFAESIGAYQEQLRSLLVKARAQGAEIAIYGVGVRACSVVNGLQLGPQIDFALDDQAEKQGKFLPGSQLETRPRESLQGLGQPLVILLAVNNENETTVLNGLKSDTLISRPIHALTVCGPKNVLTELDELARAIEAFGALPEADSPRAVPS